MRYLSIFILFISVASQAAVRAVEFKSLQVVGFYTPSLLHLQGKDRNNVWIQVRISSRETGMLGYCHAAGLVKMGNPNAGYLTVTVDNFTETAGTPRVISGEATQCISTPY